MGSWFHVKLVTMNCLKTSAKMQVRRSRNQTFSKSACSQLPFTTSNLFFTKPYNAIPYYLAKCSKKYQHASKLAFHHATVISTPTFKVAIMPSETDVAPKDVECGLDGIGWEIAMLRAFFCANNNENLNLCFGLLW